MGHLPRDNRSLLDQGRKAGLKTSEIYQALASRQPSAGDLNGQVDGNGYTLALDSQCHPIYRPNPETR